MFTIIDIVDEVAKETGVKKSVIKRIIDFQFKILKEEIGSGNFKKIHIKYLGKFVPNGRFYYYLSKYGRLRKEEHMYALAEEIKRNLSRVEERYSPVRRDNGTGPGES